MTLADQATNSIQADNANMAIQGNVAMKVTQSGGQLWDQCKRRHPLTKFLDKDSNTPKMLDKFSG